MLKITCVVIYALLYFQGDYYTFQEEFIFLISVVQNIKET